MIKLIFILLLLALRTNGQSFQCQRSASSKDKKKSPKFLCSVKVTFQREYGCSASVKEEFVFPHTTGKDAFRDIPHIQNLQYVANLTVLRNGVQVPSRFGNVANKKDILRVSMPTTRSSIPVTFTVSYQVSNAVMLWTKSCGSKEEIIPNRNIMTWRSGDWDKSFDYLHVSFVTFNENATLSPAGSSSSANSVTQNGPQNVIFDKTRVSKNIEVYASESGGDICPMERVCYPTYKFVNVRKIIIYSFVGFAALVFCCCCTACHLCGGSSTLKVFGKPVRRFNSGHSSSDCGDYGDYGGGGDGGGGDGGGGDGGGGGGDG